MFSVEAVQVGEQLRFKYGNEVYWNLDNHLHQAHLIDDAFTLFICTTCISVHSRISVDAIFISFFGKFYWEIVNFTLRTFSSDLACKWSLKGIPMKLPLL